MVIAPEKAEELTEFELEMVSGLEKAVDIHLRKEYSPFERAYIDFTVPESYNNNKITRRIIEGLRLRYESSGRWKVEITIPDDLTHMVFYPQRS